MVFFQCIERKLDYADMSHRHSLLLRADELGGLEAGVMGDRPQGPGEREYQTELSEQEVMGGPEFTCGS